MGSAVLGAVATLVIGHGPGSVLGLFIVAGTVVAALAVRPGAVRVLLPVPALSYVVAAVAVGMIADPPDDTSKAALAVAAAQWIASGFLTMVLATALAVMLTAIRWFLWHSSEPAPDRPDRRGSRRKGRADRDDSGASGPYGPYGTPVSFGPQEAMGNYVYQAGLPGPSLGNTGGLGSQDRYGDTREPGSQDRYGNTWEPGSQDGYGNTSGLGGHGRFGNTREPGSQDGYGNTGGLGDQGVYRDTWGPENQGGYGNAGGLGPVGRAGGWGDLGAPDPGRPESWPEALTPS